MYVLEQNWTSLSGAAVIWQMEIALDMATHGLGNMVAFFPEVGLIDYSLVQLVYICDPALD